MSYKVLIVDNDNGQVLYDKEDAVAFVGAISDGKTTTVNALTSCTAFDIAYAVRGAQKAADELISKHPEVKFLLALLSAEDE